MISGNRFSLGPEQVLYLIEAKTTALWAVIHSVGEQQSEDHLSVADSRGG
jgi:hypothetical protein